MVLRILTYVFAAMAITAAAVAAYSAGSWMPLLMTAPIALIVVLNTAGRPGQRR